jgi:hypothetical protein
MKEGPGTPGPGEICIAPIRQSEPEEQKPWGKLQAALLERQDGHCVYAALLEIICQHFPTSCEEGDVDTETIHHL